MHFIAHTLDDMLRDVVKGILTSGNPVNPTRGENRELTGVLLELTNPRARLSRTETRGKLFSGLGELCWYLSKRNELQFISYYVPHYETHEERADDGVVRGAYGPRLFDWDGVNQVENVTKLLTRKPSSRQAVIQLFDANDLMTGDQNVPCTCTLQFMIRGGALQMFTYMRSNDWYLGLPHDLFCFTMLQEIVARTLRVELGSYKHSVGSLHLYDRDREAADRFLGEGWQSTSTPMPSMPIGNPWSSIERMLLAEEELRNGRELDESDVGDLDSYWADLVRLLQVFRYRKNGNSIEIRALRERMSSDVYDQFIDEKLSRLG